METGKANAFAPGTSILGGAASGLSYEGAVRDAMARDDSARRRQEGARRPVAAPQSQSPWYEAPSRAVAARAGH